MLLEAQPEAALEETHDDRVARVVAEIRAERIAKDRAKRPADASKRNKDWRAQNREHVRQYKHDRYHHKKATDPSYIRARYDYVLKRKYGISIEERDALLAAQAMRCAVCFSDSPGNREWHVDHCHKTGRVRGILCATCNQGLGLLREDKAILNSAIEYLERNGG